MASVGCPSNKNIPKDIIWNRNHTSNTMSLTKIPILKQNNVLTTYIVKNITVFYLGISVAVTKDQ